MSQLFGRLSCVLRRPQLKRFTTGSSVPPTATPPAAPPSTPKSSANATASTGGGTGKGKGPITWKSFAVISIGGAGLLSFMWYVKNEKEEGINLIRIMI